MTKIIQTRSESFLHIHEKIDATKKDVDKLDSTTAKKSELQHYATEKFVYTTIAVILLSLCGLYAYVTPLLIDSKTSKIESKLDRILEILQPKTENK